MKHTPGPWKVRSRTSTSTNKTVWTIQPRDAHAMDDNQAIATIGYGAAETQQANARLIAAAPMLAEALQKMKDTHGTHGPCEQHSCQSCQAAYVAAHAALALLED